MNLPQKNVNPEKKHRIQGTMLNAKTDKISEVHAPINCMKKIIPLKIIIK